MRKDSADYRCGLLYAEGILAEVNNNVMAWRQGYSNRCIDILLHSYFNKLDVSQVHEHTPIIFLAGLFPLNVVIA